MNISDENIPLESDETAELRNSFPAVVLRQKTQIFFFFYAYDDITVHYIKTKKKFGFNLTLNKFVMKDFDNFFCSIIHIIFCQPSFERMYKESRNFAFLFSHPPRCVH